MLVVSKRTFHPYDDSRNPRYKQTPILSNIFETIYIKIPVKQIPFSRCDDISNAFPNETQNELVFATLRPVLRTHINHTPINTVPSRSWTVQANSSCPNSAIAYHTQETTQWHDTNTTKSTLHLRFFKLRASLELQRHRRLSCRFVTSVALCRKALISPGGNFWKFHDIGCSPSSHTTSKTPQSQWLHKNC